MYGLLPLLCFVCLSAYAAPAFSVDNVVAQEKNVIRRRFGAASRMDSLLSRADEIPLSNEASLVYAESSTFGRRPALSSEITLKSNKTILVLEQYEHLFNNIECKGSTLVLSQSSFRQSSCKELRTLDDGYIITSHHSCNRAGSRQVYQILGVNDTAHSISYRVQPVSWREAFGKLDVQMSRSPHEHYMRPHGKRAPYPYRHGAISGTPSNYSSGATGTAALPMATETGTHHMLDLDFSLIDKSLGQFAIPIPGVETTVPVELGCANCSTYGSLDLELGDFSIDWDAMEVEGGASISAHGVGAHIELDIQLAHSWEFAVPIPAFGYSFVYEIDDMMNVTLATGFEVAGGYDMKGEIGMTYGFDMTVPDDSTIVINVANPDHSSMRGFDKISSNLLPFQTHANLQSLNVWVALRSVVSVGVAVSELTIDAGASVGAHLDTPILQATITPVADVDANCDPLPASKTAYQKIEESVLDSVIRIDSTAGIDFGASAAIETDLHSFEYGSPKSFSPSLEVPLGAMCLNHDPSTGLYVSAQQVVDTAEAKIKRKAEQEAKAAAKAAKKKIDNLFSNSANGWTELLGRHKTVVALSFLFATFCTL